MSKFTKQEQLSFELNKHYAAVLASNFGWVSVHSTKDGCMFKDRKGKRVELNSSQLKIAAQRIEKGEAHDQDAE